MDDNLYIKYNVLITANPLHDNSIAKTIFKTIRQLDILSRDLKIFMPGFYSDSDLNQDNSSLDVVNRNIAQLRQHNLENHSDFHGKEPVFHTYCDSAGNMYFNDADFSQFMNDFEDECPNFNYIGQTELVLLPTHKGEILYDKVSVYNLEPFSNNPKTSVEVFLLSTIKKLLKGPLKNDLKCRDLIDDLYESSIKTEDLEQESAIIPLRIDSQLLQYMKWKEHDEVFFISYSTKDEYSAFALKALLEKNGKQVWIAPDGIPSGFDYAMAIPAALRITSRFLVLLSDNSANSKWVRKEIDRAINENLKIDGIFLDNFDQNKLNFYDHLAFLFADNQLRCTLDVLFEQGEEFQKLLNK